MKYKIKSKAISFFSILVVIPLMTIIKPGRYVECVGNVINKILGQSNHNQCSSRFK